MASRLIQNRLPERVAGSTPVVGDDFSDSVKTEPKQSCATFCPCDSAQKRDKFVAGQSEDSKPPMAATQIAVKKTAAVFIT